MTVAFTDNYSFSHRFSSDSAGIDTVDYQEIIHQCHGGNATALTRQFFQFALGCGFSPRSMVEAFESLADEYGQAYCKEQ